MSVYVSPSIFVHEVGHVGACLLWFIFSGGSDRVVRNWKETQTANPTSFTVALDGFGLTLSGISTIIRSSSKIVDTGDTASFF